jgi:thiol-disulfide isomerase/thioredoxin
MSKILIVRIFFILIIVSLLISIVVISVKRKTENNHVVNNYSYIPRFTFLSLNNKKITQNDIKSESKRIIFNYFNPSCDHCQNMALQFSDNKIKMLKVTLLMITSSDSASVIKFKMDFQLSTMPNIILLRDTDNSFFKIFGTANVPSFYIYDDRKFVKQIIGETEIDNILN